VALEVPDRVQQVLAQAVHAVRAQAPAGLRWSDPARCHLTVAFLGEVTHSQLGHLSAGLTRAAARHRPPTVRVDGVGRFDGRVLWAAVVEEEASAGHLTGLARSVAAASRRAGIALQERAYRPHLTLARAVRAVELRPLVAAMAGTSSGPWTARELHLVSSRLGPAPEHTTIRSFAIGPAG